MNITRPFRLALALCVALGLWLLMQPLTARAETIIVTNSSDDGPGSLRAAIAAANPGDTITFAGDYTIGLNSQLVVNKIVTVDGGGRSVTISGNSATRLFTIEATGVVTLSRLSLINGNVDGYGGGIHNAGAVTLLNSTLSGNQGAGAGGGIYNAGTLTIRNSTLSHNTRRAQSGGFSGGGVYNTGALTVMHSVFSNNSAAGGDSGGGVYNAGTLTVTHSTFSGNSAPTSGGGLFNAPGRSATIQNSTFSSNVTSGSGAGPGGGIYNAGTLTVTNSTFSNNRSGMSTGGAIYNVATASVRNSTLAFNWAGSSDLTAGIHNGGTLSLYNTIVARSAQGVDCRNTGTLAANVHNLIQTNSENSCGTPYLSDDPLLDEQLDDNGGPTHTHLPGAGSPVINQGDPATCLALDQRGYGRAGACDIGAVEVGGLSPAIAVLGNGWLIANGAADPNSADGTDFGEVLAGESLTHTFTISNSGQVTLTVSNFTLSGPGAADFSVSGLSLPAHIPTATGGTFQVIFAPTMSGARAVTLTLANNDPDENPYAFALQGTGLAPDIAVLGNGLLIANGDTTPTTAGGTDFGSLTTVAALIHTFTISNSGTGPLGLTGAPLVAFTGPAAADFSLVVSPTTPLPPGEATTFQVRFAPSALGLRAATLVIANNTFDKNPYTFAVQGTAPCWFAADVQTTHDSGARSLRQMLAEACLGATLTFAPELAGQTLALTSAELSLTRTVTLANPRAPGLVISGNNARRIFHIQAGAVVTLSQLTLNNGKVTGGSGCPTYCGGGIYNAGALTVLSSTLSSNAAGFWGGGIYNAGTLVVQASTFSGNSAALWGAGGGIYNDNALTVFNSTFSGNSGGFNGAGGGIYNDGTLAVQHGTFSGNTAGGGGGLFNTAGRSLALRNTLIANSPRGGDCYNEGVLVVNAHNLVRDGGCAAAFSGDPLLGALTGSPATFPLQPASPAIDAGDVGSCLPTDQRGEPRDDLGCDIGAYELRDFGGALTKSAAPYSFGPARVRLTVNSGNPGAVSVLKHAQAVGAFREDNEAAVQWAITADGSEFDVDLDLCYLAEEIDGLNEGDLRAYRWNGSAWDGPLGNAPTGNCVTVPNVTGFSQWTLATPDGPTAARVVGVAARGLAPVAALPLAGLLALGGAATFLRRRRRL